MLAVLWVIARLSERGRISLTKARWLLVVVTFLDLWVLGAIVCSMSGLKAAGRAEPGAGDARGNRAARASRAIVQEHAHADRSGTDLAYRTLDLPAVPELTLLAHGARMRRHRRAAGPGCAACDRDRLARLRSDRKPANAVLKRVDQPRETIEDPALASWLFGASWVADQGRGRGHVLDLACRNRAVRAWLVPSSAIPEPAMLDDWSGDPREILEILDLAEPLAAGLATPDEWTISVRDRRPGWVIVSQLADPQWTAHVDRSGRARCGDERDPAGIPQRIAAGGLAASRGSRAGRWTLRLEYDARDVAEGR